MVGDAGILVPPSDHKALGRAIRELLADPYHAADLGQAGYQRVQEQFTWLKAAEKTTAAYREVIDGYRRI